MSLIVDLAGIVRPYTSSIAIALIATLLVIFGGAINEMVRTLIKTQPMWLRVLVFILLCTFGYGILSVWLTGLLQGYLRGLSAGMFLLQVSLAFVVIGVLAERSRWR
ncbi:DUF3392 family protein [Venatoribacter cucullus]|uniref:DUF3392 family protein n=1 Tax=Venatoribacter cucullus TaxID=2661630 RepID=UPI001935D71F|nr:DUF3392 family protein [Venatoribacter cucullus]QQD20336.1 DUF3392 family protein [Oceanospirillaceae bacterium ASx5O]UZK02484.1 DUF3392 family protein [Venatoribacter cucullus]